VRLDGSAFHDFYTIKSFWVGDFGANINLTFGGARHHLISDTHAQCTHQFLMGMINMF
jgi:hypothetical protein